MSETDAKVIGRARVARETRGHHEPGREENGRNASGVTTLTSGSPKREREAEDAKGEAGSHELDLP